MTFDLIVLGAPRTKKTHNDLVRLPPLPGRHKARMVLMPSRQWRQWVKGAAIVVLAEGRSCDYTYLRPFKRGRMIDQERVTLPGYFFLGLRPLTTERVRCAATFYRDRNHGDAVGYFQGLADLLEKRSVLKNDRQIVDWAGSQLLKDAKRPRVEVRIEVLE